MLNFFKKPGRGVNNINDFINQSNEKNKKQPTNNFQSENIFDESLIDNDEEIKLESRSRLSMNLTEIISEKNCLSYFVQFLETKNALSLIKFYLDAECFKSATEKVVTLESLKENNNVVNYKRGTNVNEDEENKNSLSECSNKNLDDGNKNGFDDASKLKNLKNNQSSNDDKNTVPELKTLCDLSMRKPLTDDEKSLIYAETNKKCIYNNSNNDVDIIKINNSKSSMKLSSSIIASEAIRIYRKYLNTNSQYFIDLSATILSQISLELCAQQKDECDSENSQMISSSCFIEAQKHIFERFEIEFLNEFLESPYYCKYTVEVLTNSNDLLLSDILNSESALFYFMEYLEQENQRYLLEFWIAAMNFRKHYLTQIPYDNYNYTEAQNDAMILYEKYFSLQASCPLRSSDKIRSIVEEHICSCDDNKTGKLLGKCFDQPLKIIENFIKKNHFKNFLSCQLFANYLNELKSKVEHHKSSKWKSSLRKNSSNYGKNLTESIFKSTNELTTNYISQQNTLLAMESNKYSTKLRKDKTAVAADMQIDSKYLMNPDLLWQREKNIGNGNLTFGRVNSLGRYERDFDIRGTSEEKWSFLSGGNKIKNAVRKFVNLPEDKVREEIAWQVAEMIVKDVTSITLGNDSDITD